MCCFNDPAWKVCGWGGVVADTNYIYPARWGWINSSLGLDKKSKEIGGRQHSGGANLQGVSEDPPWRARY